MRHSILLTAALTFLAFFLHAQLAQPSAGGKVIWTFNAVRDFNTVNGVSAKGGSFGSAVPVIVGGMVFATSGYPGTLRGTPGNCLARVRSGVS